MVFLKPSPSISAFMKCHLHDFFHDFGIGYCIDGPQLEYFVFQKKTGRDISCSLTVSYDCAIAEIYVMTFYPGLWQYPQTKYLSAVCFFLVIQHVANFNHIECDCRINLNTERAIFNKFYSLLKDFDFHIQSYYKDKRVCIQSPFLSSKIDTSMFIERALVY